MFRVLRCCRAMQSARGTWRGLVGDAYMVRGIRLCDGGGGRFAASETMRERKREGVREGRSRELNGKIDKETICCARDYFGRNQKVV